MHINKKIKNTAFLAVFSIFCAASLSAYQINITVNDEELDFPLEGVKITVKDDSSISTYTDEDGNSITVPLLVLSVLQRNHPDGKQRVHYYFNANTLQRVIRRR